MHEATAAEVEEALDALDRRPRVVAAAEFPDSLEGLGHPGLYSWWSDAPGAGALSAGLGHAIVAGRIYAGQAGAVAWPSSTVRVSTLRSRIGTNHLGGTVRGSTFRLTLASALREVLDLEVVGDRRLSRSSEVALTRWMREHLSLAVHAFPDAERLGDLEDRVLAVLDPPLNLDGMAPTPLRLALRGRRRLLRSKADAEAAPVAETAAVTHGATAAGTITLHEEIAQILRERGNPWTSTQELADLVNARGRYHKRDGSAVTAFQVHGRTRNYQVMFERDGSLVRLRSGS